MNPKWRWKEGGSDASVRLSTGASNARRRAKREANSTTTTRANVPTSVVFGQSVHRKSPSIADHARTNKQSTTVDAEATNASPKFAKRHSSNAKNAKICKN